MAEFDDRVVIVTGGTGNLGSAVARRFQAAGAHLVVVDRNAEGMSQLFPQMVGAKEHLLAGGKDVTSPEEMGSLANEIMTRFGRIDCLINTVGGYRAGAPLHETTVETWDLMMNLNARSTFVVSRAMIPAMLKKSYGRIVNISARPGLAAQGNDSAYSAAKSAVARLTESMAAEYKHQGLRVNAILPSALVTPEDVKSDPTRGVTPDAVADVALFLCSQAGSIINGALIPAYGERF